MRGFPGFPGSLAGCWEKLPREEPEIGACPEEEEGALGWKWDGKARARHEEDILTLAEPAPSPTSADCLLQAAEVE